jgi:membrane-bound metal-dependent hydrolase YbcI (DUF457 family)
MFVGHFAAALAAKRVAPRLPLGWLVAAGFALDLIWPVLLLSGVERLRVDPGNTRFTPLAFDHYPWSHSLLMAVVWAALAAAISRRSTDARGAAIFAAVVFSHWLLDLVTHRPDLPLWPGGGMLLGFGLWNSVVATFAVEGMLFALALLAYMRRASARSAGGRWGLYGLVAVMTLIWAAGPFSPPPPSATAVAISALAIWVFPLWAGWIDRRQ